MSDISLMLKTKRRELKISVKSVLEQLHSYGIDVSDKTLYGWESGHRQPDADTFLILCKIYGIDSISEMKKAPAEAEAIDDEFKEQVKILTDFFVKRGYIEAGGDLTDEQFKVAMALVDFLDSYFG